jgi:hypothetical protein
LGTVLPGELPLTLRPEPIAELFELFELLELFELFELFEIGALSSETEEATPVFAKTAKKATVNDKIKITVTASIIKYARPGSTALSTFFLQA